MLQQSDALLSGAVCSDAPTALIPQAISFPADYHVPHATSVPAYQLVGVFHALLGEPELPRGARVSSLAAKWGLLHAALLRRRCSSSAPAAGVTDTAAAAYHAAVPRLLERTLLARVAVKLAAVLANPAVPPAARRAAAARHALLVHHCHTAVDTWTTAVAASPSMCVLHSALELVAPAVSAAVAAHTSGQQQQQQQAGAGRGRLMEAAALAALRGRLPSGWTLHSNLHVIKLDGAPLLGAPGLKQELDALVLDEGGAAVAIVEVKLGAGNPVGALLDDAASLTRVKRTLAGRQLTAITLSHGPLDVRGGSTADSSSSGSSSSSSGVESTNESRSRGKAVRGWTTLNVPVGSDVLPLYVVGQAVDGEGVRRGLAALVDSTSLRIMARSAEDAAACILMPPESDNASGTAPCSSCPPGVMTRVALRLGAAQRAEIAQQQQERFAALQDCMVFSLHALNACD
jgi:hypothetical protein